jgi:periplasmic divalent cation tolerance protein
MPAALVYMTCASRAEAEKVSEALITKRLAACTNILENMTSLFHWKGRVESDAETVLLAKTRQDLVEALTNAVAEVHSYEIPCVVALPIVGGHPDFLAWIEEETGEG